MSPIVSRALFRLGVWCFERSGRRVDYIDALQIAEESRCRAEKAAMERHATVRVLDNLLRSIALVDGLLSSGTVDVAHQQLRVAIINAGGIASVRAASRSSTRREP